MNLLIYSCMPVLTPNYGGAVRVYNIAEKLSERGVNVTLVSPYPLEIASPLNSSVRYIFVNSITSKICQRIKLFSKIKPVLHFFIFLDDLFVLKKILCNQPKSSNVFLQSEYLYSIVPLYILKKMYSVPLVITEHNVESEVSFQINNNKIYYNFLKSVERYFLNKCDLIVCVSDSDKNTFYEKYHIPSQKIIVGPNATNIPEVNGDIRKKSTEIKSFFSIDNNTFTILFLGTLQYYPNQKAVELIQSEIYPRVKSQVSNVKFLIVGKGVDPKIDGDIIFTGLVDDVLPYIYLSDIAIAPLIQGGGTRLKILEYMAISKPVVSTSKGAEGLDVVNHENIIISDNWEDFSNEIINLLLNDKNRSRIGNNARKLIEEKYTWEATCEKYIEAYCKLNPRTH